MHEVKLSRQSVVFDNQLLSDKAYNQMAGKAKIINLFTPSESSGFGIFLYTRTILSPGSRAVQQDGLILSYTSCDSTYTSNSLNHSYLSSPALPIDIFNDAVLNNPNHPPAIVDCLGFIHLLQLRKSQGQGYIWYLLNSGPYFKAA